MNNIDILKPQCRLDDLWVRVITKNDVDLPLPQSRLELYVTALITGNIDNLPYPQSRVEMLLYCILTDTEYTFNAQSRVEMFIKAIITLDIEGLPTPMSRLEWYLDYIVRNGCLEKYEYYPFQIRDYLNVKNTPKAKMKFKGMKGNTLVNICPQKRISFTRQGGDSTKYFLREFVVPMAKRNTVYTIIVNVLSTPATNYTTLFSWINDGAMGTPKDYKLSTTGMHVFTMRTNDIDFPKGITFRFASGHGGVDGEYICDDLVILEGDHTQNPPNGYIEGIKSFGESENKIEVLSVCKNIHNEREYPLKGEMILSQITGDVEYSKGSYNYTTDFVPMFHKGIVTLSTKDRSTWKKIAYYTKDKKFIKSDFCTDEFLEFYSLPPSNAAFYRIGVNMGKVGLNYTFAQLEYGKISTSYAEYQGFSKAMPMYRNSNNELIPIPLLRGKWEGDRFLWGDEILLHEDGKLYYHKRYEFVLLTGLEKEWTLNGVSKFLEYKLTIPPTIDNRYNFINDRLPQNGIGASVEHNKIGIDSTHHGAIRIKPLEKDDMTLEEGLNWIKSNNISLVYQLDQEEVYPCELSEQLYSFDNETNIFINGGAVVGETVIEVGTKLGPIVAEIKQETLRNARAVEGLLAHGVQEMAYQLYPDDFNTTGDIEKR